MSPDSHRLSMLPTLKQVYEPLARDIDFFRRFYGEILASYAGRCVSDPNYFAKVVRFNEREPPEICMNRPGGYSPSNLLIRGLSGSGKTTAVERWLDAIPQAIRHSKYKERVFCTTQVPWVRINCPPDASAKSICKDFYVALDSILDTHYLNRYNKKGVDTKDHLNNFARLCALHGVATIVIDHTENLSSSKTGGAGLLNNFLYNLVTTSGVFVVLIGTYEADPILIPSFRQTRRVLPLGSVPWERLKDKDFDRILKAVWQIQFTRESTPLTLELNKTFYYETQGVPDLIWVLYKLAQERAITTRQTTNTEEITCNLVASVAHDNFGLLQPALNALRQGKADSSVRLPDLPPELYSDKTTVKQSASSNVAPGTFLNDSDFERELVSAVAAAGEAEASSYEKLSESGLVPGAAELFG